MRNLNQRIEKIARDYVKDKGSNERRGHLPGWARNRLWLVSTSEASLGHVFCFQRFSSLDDPEVYLQPWCDRAKGESTDQFKTLDQFNLDPDTCNTTAEFDHDASYTYECGMSKIHKYDPEQIAPGAQLLLPENFAKVLHPRPNGFSAYARGMRNALLNERPAMHRSENCLPM